MNDPNGLGNSRSPSQALRAAIGGDPAAIEPLWTMTYGAIRERIAAIRSCGGDGSMVQATAVANDLFLLQRRRGFRRTDIEWAFKIAGVDVEAFARGTEELSDSQVGRILVLITASDARSHLYEHRRRQRRRPPAPPYDPDASVQGVRKVGPGHTTVVEEIDLLLGLERLRAHRDTRLFVICAHYYVLGHTFEEIAALVGVTRVRVGQLHAMALRLLDETANTMEA